jgi:membrane-associated HD superfamily phosphohydrolase
LLRIYDFGTVLVRQPKAINPSSFVEHITLLVRTCLHLGADSTNESITVIGFVIVPFGANNPVTLLMMLLLLLLSLCCCCKCTLLYTGKPPNNNYFVLVLYVLCDFVLLVARRRQSAPASVDRSTTAILRLTANGHFLLGSAVGCHQKKMVPERVSESVHLLCSGLSSENGR